MFAERVRKTLGVVFLIFLIISFNKLHRWKSSPVQTVIKLGSNESTSKLMDGIINIKKVNKRQSLRLFLLILSAPSYKDRRDGVRKGYISVWRGCFEYKFLVGRSHNETLDEMVKRENGIHKDILLYPYEDSYSTLTSKVIWGFYNTTRDYAFDYLIKTDDDTFLNIKTISAFIAEHVNDTLLFAGRVKHPVNLIVHGKPFANLTKEG